MEYENILKLIKEVSNSNLTSFEYEADGVKICLQSKGNVKEQLQPRPLPIYREQEAIESQPEVVEEKGGIIIESPLVGVFYVAPSEDAKAFVQVGDVVKEGQTLAIVEAMKLMNEIESEVQGTVAEVLVQNGESVEYGQPLFRII